MACRGFEGREHQLEAAGEALLGEDGEGGLGAGPAGRLLGGAVVPEVVVAAVAFPGDQGRLAAGASTPAGEAGGHLGDVDEGPVRPLPEQQAVAAGPHGRTTSRPTSTF